MKKTIEHLRKKEQHEKDRIAFMGAVTITVFIALFWLAGVTTSGVYSIEEDQSANTITPFDSIKEQFSELVEQFQK
jgi:hypothetical protein